MKWALEEIGMPTPKPQVRSGKYFLDFAYPDHKIAIECDGVYFHQNKEREAIRDATLEENGWTVLHFPEVRLRTDAIGCAEEVKRIHSNHSGRFKFVPLEVRSRREYKLQRREFVCNLGVAEDNSYVAKGYVVHNCGAYSLLNSANKNAANQKKDASDIPLFLEYVAEIKPLYFVMDDLPQSFVALPMSEYHRLLPEYDLFPEWVSNYHYGNPQRFRTRMFMIGALKSEGYTFVPGETDEHESWTVEERIKDIEGKFGSVANHDEHTTKGYSSRFINMRNRGDRPDWGEVQKFFKKHQKPGQNFKYHGEDGMKVRPSLIRIKYDYPSPVLTGGNPMMHPTLCLPLSVRERARIQGFPDDFVFYGTKFDDDGRWEHNNHNMWMVKQTGKAMPIEFNRYVAEQIAAHVQERSFKSSGARFLKANPFIDQAKTWFCEEIGYDRQENACRACWLAPTCTLDRKAIDDRVPFDVMDLLR
jgi:hypothetical protein